MPAPRPTRLSAAERAAALQELPRWAPVEGRDAIQRRFVFADFRQAFAFMTEVALLAEQLDHHPEWANVWNRVDVTLSTHDAGGLTALDLRLAAAMDAIAARRG